MTTCTPWFDFVKEEEHYKLFMFKQTLKLLKSIIEVSGPSELLVFPLYYTEVHAKIGYNKVFLKRNFS